MVEGDIRSRNLAISQLQKNEEEYLFHMRRMERGEPKPGIRRREEDFDPKMMEAGLKDIQGNIRKHKQNVNVLEKRKYELGIKLGRILAGVSKN